MTERCRRRLTEVPPWVVLVEVFVGLGWLRAAVEKVISPSWWAGDELAAFVDEQAAAALPWYEPFLTGVVGDQLVLTSVLVLALQLAVAASLVTGRGAVIGLCVGMALNLNFVLAGAVNPSVFYLVLQLAVVLWRIETGLVGRSTATWLELAGTTAALAALPFIATLHPADVIEDPAVVLVLVGLLTAVAATLAQGAPVARPHSSVVQSGGR